jgi:hypothetical protein
VRERIRWFWRTAQPVAKTGFRPVIQGSGNLFLPLVEGVRSPNPSLASALPMR